VGVVVDERKVRDRCGISSNKLRDVRRRITLGCGDD
jgi:hypothetical protein